MKRIVDEQYQRGMKLLRDNMFLLDELAKLLMEQEKVSGEELVKLINRAAIDGKLAVDNKHMAFAAFMGEKVDNTSTGSKLTSSSDFTETNHDADRRSISETKGDKTSSLTNGPCHQSGHFSLPALPKVQRRLASTPNPRPVFLCSVSSLHHGQASAFHL